MTETHWDEQLDTCGLNCPLPLLKAKQALHKLESGKILKVVATDAGSQRDFKAFVDQSDHQMLESFSEDDRYTYFIQRG
ncbi:sulfurtransferase TusA family protein [Amphritea sp. 2_MG-2023]|jgi:tRNA 2-thiouridine synthesizing protein A|uniref:sulfurtransferase TusA family protein n=1 Tax=Amphritea TaxID=515417 RepID=UPI001C0721C2|nr:MULTISPECIES: sulfurtransferase TusA family protein [Amphritea]MBU2966500.1 sulfurtransferase TusA family protein [Amphritea atlantica]MDO6417641.1 sulfurtransferase TusA family protein [Amphritea sp. 2_MG-2023]MDX2422978.1 sulfurtransferase TusA family protein [Amphritea sp.]